MKAHAIAPSFARLYAALRSGFAFVGVTAVLASITISVHSEALLDELRALADDSLPVPQVSAAGPLEASREELASLEQQALAEFISRRYRIARSAALHFVAIAYRAGQQHSVDPMLILAVMAIESGYNPVAESTMGALGLMQVIPKYHPEKLAHHGGGHALLDPEVNIHVGAQILREYYRRLGDQEAALQMYAGAFDEPTAQYAGKVFAELARLEPVRQKARMQIARSA